MPRKIRFGLIGTGLDAKLRATVLRRRSDCELVATSGPGPSLKSGIHYEDARGLLARADLDAIIFAGAAKDAAEVCSTAARRALHVLCLRSPAVSPGELAALREAQRSAPMGKVTQYSFPLHYHASVGHAKRLSKEGSLGCLLTMRGVFGVVREPTVDDRGGALLDRGAQMIDLMSAFAGPFDDVKGFVGQRAWDNPGADDNAMALLRTVDGVIGSVHASSTSWRETFRLELGYSHGYLWLDGLIGGDGSLEPEVLVIGRPDVGKDGVPLANPNEEIKRFQTDNTVELELADFLHAIHGRGPQTVGIGQQAFEALTLVHRLYSDDPSWSEPSLRTAAE
ncbi:MAG: Gfo/Idh/MocA family oxidoreductase [Pseudomonadota bacterium]